MNSQDDQRVERAMALVDEARALAFTGRHGPALQKQDDAERILRSLKADYPDDHRPGYALASMLYSKATSLAAERRPTDAIAALRESEQGYEKLRDAGDAQADRLIADVRARRGVIEADRGRGASAVVELDTAVTMYLRILSQPSAVLKLQDLLDLARVVSLNAYVLRRYGDPDLATISADYALTVYLSHAQEINANPLIAHMHTYYLRSAARTATEIHAVHDRLQIAIQAADMYEQTARSLGQSGEPEDLVELATALAWKGLIWQARDGGTDAERCLAEARSLDRSVVERVDDAWHAAKKRRHPLLNTLTSALEVAARELGSKRVNADLARAMASPPTRGSTVFTPSARCLGEIALVRAQQLAELVTDLLPSAPEAALRLGLEAHYLFTAASREQTAMFRYQFSDWGVPWARALLACSRTYRDRGDLHMAADLGDWCLGVAQQLLPFTVLDSTLSPLLREIELHQRDTTKRAYEEAATRSQDEPEAARTSDSVPREQVCPCGSGMAFVDCHGAANE